jgi:hypothetical protein
MSGAVAQARRRSANTNGNGNGDGDGNGNQETAVDDEGWCLSLHFLQNRVDAIQQTNE